MWKEHLEEIRQEEKRYGADINCGISEEEAGGFIKAVKAMEYITDKERGNFNQLSRENGDHKIVILYWD